VADKSVVVQCASAEQRTRLVITVEDFRRREITYRTVGSSGHRVCAPANSSVCNISVVESREGIYILEVFADGEQVRSERERAAANGTEELRLERTQTQKRG
jgi:hypothetical protein